MSNSIEPATIAPLRSYSPTLKDYALAVTTASPALASSYDRSGLEDGYSQPNTNYLGYDLQPPFASPFSTSAYPYRVTARPIIVSPTFDPQASSESLSIQGLPETTYKVFRQNARQDALNSAAARRRYSQYVRREPSLDLPEYDGHHTNANGFQYYLKTHYHEEDKSKNSDKSVGSFGYVDPFGIRRVVYYKSDPQNGFVHRKNNRFVGFNAKPYDPLPPN